VDDFGTGYSCLSSLWRFPFDKIKIDKSFLVGRHYRQDHAEKIVGSIVALARSLSMSVTVEGVETIDQAKCLKELKCDQLQGFFFSRPVPPEEVPIMLLNGQIGRPYSDKNVAQERKALADLKNGQGAD
jgi:EAL domain-containing protein (putative c-di-GMP-specific phosphodiesterase class I)